MIKHIGNRLLGSYSPKSNAPIFEVDFEDNKAYPNGDTLPSIWVSKPVEDSEGNPLGRTYVMHYTFGSLDAGGWDALHYGGGYYDEAMSYTDPADRDKRIDCFKAAELLYRHAAGRGNAVANLCLGYVYSYDRCEGHYWVDPMTLETEEDYKRPYPREERAFECFEQAAEAGICEACYKLGDMHKHGTGCVPDTSEAFYWYLRASELTDGEQPVILGSVALRLGECYEEAIGCAPDFARALSWYRQAVAALDVAVDAGESWYAKALASARAGVKRCEQEVAVAKQTLHVSSG